MPREKDAIGFRPAPRAMAAPRGRPLPLRPLPILVAGAERLRISACPAPTPPQPDSAPSPIVTPGPAPPYAIREAQSLRAKLGQRPGPADGVWSDATRAAFRAFLDAEGLPAAETLTPQALRAMRAAARRGIADAGASEEARTDVSEEEASEEVSPEPAPRPPAPPRVDLHAAVQSGDAGEVTAALSAGADVNGQDDRGWTALMRAVNEGRSPLVELLLASKANPDHRASDGSTALHIAVGLRHAEIVALLREAGADPWIEGPGGRTAAEAARAGGSAAVVAALRLPRKGEVFRDCAECPPMVVVEEGRYMMGSPRDEAGRWDDEGPRHEVRIARPFAIGRFEVTFAQWDARRRAGRCSHAPDDGRWGRGTRPVINVSWKDAGEYVGWLSEKTGESYRLPSEAEWEYAARAKTDSAYYWGENVRPRRARCSRCDGGSGEVGTVSVGDFPPNGFGLFDMLGNVWEWVSVESEGGKSGFVRKAGLTPAARSELRTVVGGMIHCGPGDPGSNSTRGDHSRRARPSGLDATSRDESCCIPRSFVVPAPGIRQSAWNLADPSVGDIGSACVGKDSGHRLSRTSGGSSARRDTRLLTSSNGWRYGSVGDTEVAVRS